MHLRRKGEDSVSKTIDLEYVSSGHHGASFDDGSPEMGEESSSSELTERYTPTSPPPVRVIPEPATGGWRRLRVIESGKQARSASSSSSAGNHGPRTQRLRESRKTPFSRSPPRRSLRGDDEDLDTILKAQRQEDEANLKGGHTDLPKRKREILSDTGFRLRKERTDDLVEGLRNVRAVRALSTSHSRRRVPTDLDPPPPPPLGEDPDDADSEDDAEIGMVSETLATLGMESEGQVCDLKKASRVILTIRQLRRIMAAKESIFKYGIFVPKSEREAESSPEAPRWRAGRDLEWFRLR
jgi:hypothetical protein